MGIRMASLVVVLGALACCELPASAGTSLMAGVAKINATMPVGVPLAGYNYPPRRPDYWPLPHFTKYTTFMNPSQGVRDATFVKCLAIDTGGAATRLAMCTMDTIGCDPAMQTLAWNMAAARGFTIPLDRVTFHAAHTHSGPGALAPDFLWSIAPATDLMVPEVQRMFATHLADALVQAEQAMEPAKLGMGFDELLGFTHNRRAGHDPHEWSGKIDPTLGLIRLDKADGTPLATVWSFAIHGICFDSPNMHFSADIMGAVSENIELQNGGTALFINSDAGDVNPVFSKCCKNKEGKVDLHGGPVIAKHVMALRSNISTTTDVSVRIASVSQDFGATNLNLTLARVANCTKGGPLDLCSICKVLKCDANIHLPAAWLDHTPRFSAQHWILDGKDHFVATTVPGEALVELGWSIRNMTIKAGYPKSFLFGYTNNYLGYFAPPDSYQAGGYESILSFWGEDTANMVLEGVTAAFKQVIN